MKPVAKILLVRSGSGFSLETITFVSDSSPPEADSATDALDPLLFHSKSSFLPLIAALAILKLKQAEGKPVVMDARDTSAFAQMPELDCTIRNWVRESGPSAPTKRAKKIPAWLTSFTERFPDTKHAGIHRILRRVGKTGFGRTSLAEGLTADLFEFSVRREKKATPALLKEIIAWALDSQYGCSVPSAPSKVIHSPRFRIQAFRSPEQTNRLTNAILLEKARELATKQFHTRQVGSRQSQMEVERKLVLEKIIKPGPRIELVDQALTNDAIVDKRAVIAFAEETCVRWSKPMVIYCSPIIIGTAVALHYLVQVRGFPLDIYFELPHGVAIVQQILKGAISPDGFFAGEAQANQLAMGHNRDYQMGLFLANIENRVVAPQIDRLIYAPNSLEAGDYLFVPNSTLELGYRDYVRKGYVNPRLSPCQEVEPSEAIKKILEKDSHRRAFLWEPLWQFASMCNAATVLDAHIPDPHYWHSTLYCHRRLYSNASQDATRLVAAMGMAWRILQTQASERDQVVSDLILKHPNFAAHFWKASGLNHLFGEYDATARLAA